jgi:hypothetical protein
MATGEHLLFRMLWRGGIEEEFSPLKAWVANSMWRNLLKYIWRIYVRTVLMIRVVPANYEQRECRRSESISDKGRYSRQP